MMPMDKMHGDAEGPQDPGGPKDAEQGQGEDDPMKALGQGIMAMVQGLSEAPPPIAKAAAAVGDAFQNLMQVMGGAQGPSEPQAAPGAQMSGGNPNAVPMR